jgi:hypothetical protein
MDKFTLSATNMTHLGYSKHDDFDERVWSPNKIEAPTFDGRHDPWIFDMWIRDMDRFFE